MQITTSQPQARSQHKHSGGTAANTTQTMQQNRRIMQRMTFNECTTMQNNDLHLLFGGLIESDVHHVAIPFLWKCPLWHRRCFHLFKSQKDPPLPEILP